MQNGTLRALALGAVAAGVALTASCSKDKQLVMGPKPVNSLFTSYVALGNSITAGYQSGGINDSTQRESYARLLAQAMNTRYAYASFSMPGCPPPIADFHTQVRVGGGTSSTTCAFRSAFSITGVLNNLAVPGATSADPNATSTEASNPLTTLILGGMSQADRALLAKPTFASVWVGNNDALEAAVSGILVPVAGVSRGLTATATFQQNYDAMIAKLLSGGTIKGGVLVGVVQVTGAPVLFPAAAFFIPAFKAGVEQAVGLPPGGLTIHPSCGSAAAPSTALISALIIPAIKTYVASGGAASGGHPPVIACQPGVIPGTLVGDIFVVDPNEQTTLVSTVTAYDDYIKSKASSIGFAYVDPNPLLLQLKQSGQIPTVPNLASATEPFGPYISLDGIHPRAIAHRAFANLAIDSINAKYGTNLVKLSIP